MSIITTGVSKPIGNPTPEALATWLKDDFISISFYDDNITEDFNVYYNSFTGEMAVEYFKDGDVEIEFTTSTSRVIELYRKYFYNFLNNEPNRESNGA